MMRMHFTRAAVDALTLPDGKTEHFVWSDKLPGFGVKIRSHRKDWVVQYRIGLNQQRRKHLGPVSVLSSEQAHKRAKDILAAVRLGRDPAAEKRAAPVVELETYVARKALAFLKSGTKPECYLYRHFHPNGDLLYVGISLEPLTRQDRHTKAASWRRLICRILIEPFATREEALAAEQAAIRNEFPKFNVVLNGKRHPFQELPALSQ